MIRDRNVEMVIEQGSIEDAAEILDLQKLAYQSEAEIYNDFSLPPMTQTLEQIQTDFENQLFLKASIEGRIVGSVRGRLDNETCHIGRLIVHPEFQNRGIGGRLMKEIEDRFSQAARFELFTGHLSERNLRFYGKLGYKEFSAKKITDNLTLVFLEKYRVEIQIKKRKWVE